MPHSLTLAQSDPAPRAEELFEILAAEHAERLSAYLHSRLRDPGAVDDLFQETMLGAWEGLGRYDRSRPFGAWLRGIASHLLAGHLEREARLPKGAEEEALAGLEARFEGLEGEGLEEAIDALGRCVERLPESLAGMVRWVYEGGLSLGAAAERMELGLEAAKKRLQRARQQLAECLRRAGVQV
jgi:RNA polymerase sigma factor (sigma-70 family)